MKKIEQPQSKQKAIALGFTVGVHVVAIVGLLFLGLSKPPEPPKQIKTILIKPEDLPPPDPKPLIKSDSTETADNHVAETIQQTAEPTPDAPDIPTTQPDQAQADLQKATNDAQAAAAAQLAALAATKAKNEAAEAARQKAAAAEKARLDAADKLKQAKNAAEKSKAEAEMKAATEKAAKEKANQVTKDAQAKAARDAQAAKDKAAKDAQAKATRDAQAAKDKAANDAQAKATRDAQAAKDKAAKDAQAKATRDAQAAKDKAAKDAQAKAERDAQNAKDKAAKEAAERESSAERAAQEAAKNKADAKKVAGNAVAAFKRKVESSWNPPDKPGETASVSVILDNNGNVTNVSVNASDPAVKASAEKAVRAAAPYPMPDDPEARKQARSFKTLLRVK